MSDETAVAAPAPDAVRFPLDWRGNSTNAFVRADTTATIAERLLGIQRGEGICRVQGHANEVFATKSPFDTINFTTRDPREGTPRYDWKAMPEHGEGVFFGYLKPEAK